VKVNTRQELGQSQEIRQEMSIGKSETKKPLGKPSSSRR